MHINTDLSLTPHLMANLLHFLPINQQIGTTPTRVNISFDQRCCHAFRNIRPSNDNRYNLLIEEITPLRPIDIFTKTIFIKLTRSGLSNRDQIRFRNETNEEQGRIIQRAWSQASQQRFK